MTLPLRTEAMCWLRFGKRLPIVCTEVGPWSADVLGVSNGMAVEIEIKKSKGDLRADFRNKKQKHHVYATASDRAASRFVPNYLYYFVPESMGEYAVKVIEESCPKAGVAVHLGTELLGGRNTAVIRKPTRLRAGAPEQEFIRTAVMRMSSELCGRYVAHDQAMTQVLCDLAAIRESAMVTARYVGGALDCEDPEADLKRRAQELAAAVDGIEAFGELDKEQQQRWIEAAKRLLAVQHEGWDAPIRL